MGLGKSRFVLSMVGLLFIILCGPVSPALADDPGNIMAIELDSQTSGTVYLGASQAGVLKTTDNGATWTAKNAGLPSLTILDLAVDPFAPENIYIITDSGAYRSQDHGDTWAAMNLDVEGVICTALTVDYDTPGLLYVGTQAHGVFLSADHGQTWQNLQDSEQMLNVNGTAVITASDTQTQGVGAKEVRILKTMYVIDQNGVWKNLLGNAYNSEGHMVWGVEQVWIPIDIVNKNLIYTILSRAGLKVDGQKVVTIGFHEGGLYFNKENTSEWVKIDTPQEAPNINGLAGQPQAQTQAESLTAADETILYAASFDGFVMRGVYAGGVWTWNNLLDAVILGVDEVHPKVVTTVALYGEDGSVQTPPPMWVGTFAYNQPGAVYYSSDGGAVWSNVLAGGWSQ